MQHPVHCGLVAAVGDLVHVAPSALVATMCAAVAAGPPASGWLYDATPPWPSMNRTIASAAAIAW